MKKITKIINSLTQMQIILIIIATLTIISLILHGWLNKDTKWFSFVSGIFSGLVLMLFQTYLNDDVIKKIDNFSSLKVINILQRRSDKNYYNDLIKKSTSKIDLQGVTAGRFIKDFADINPHAGDDSKELIKSLERGVAVRILVAAHKFLPDTNSKVKAIAASDTILKLKQRYPNLLHMKYYYHTPDHNIFLVDDEVIVGPVFKDVPSEHTPAIHMKATSIMSQKYISNFENEWRDAKDQGDIG